MSAAFIFFKDKLTVYLDGEIDHHSVKSVRSRIDGEIAARKPSVLALDFGKVTFMDSSGIGLVMGRFKIMSESGGVVLIQNPPAPIRKVMHIAGISRLAKIVYCESVSAKDLQNDSSGAAKDAGSDTTSEKEVDSDEASKEPDEKPHDTEVSQLISE